MAIDPWTTPSARAHSELAGAIGTRDSTAAFMAKVYRWMALGLGVTGLVSMWVASTPGIIIPMLRTPFLMIGLWIVALVVSMSLPAVARRAAFAVVAAMFVGYATLLGFMLAPIFLVYTHQSIATTFFISAGAFGGMSVYGTITRKDLSSWATFLIMGFAGIFLASIVNLFLRSDAMSFVLGCAGVVVFSGLTAWHTQKLRAFAAAGDDRLAITAALILYLDFINLFLSLLRLFGRRR